MRSLPLSLRLLPWGLAALPPIAVCLFVYRFGIFVPYWDHWDFVPILASWQEGSLTLGELARPHNAHRLLFPYLIMHALAAITRWEVAYELFVNLTLGVVIAALWFVLFQRLAARDQLALRPWLPIAVSIAVFSMIQWRNWLWGWQLQVFLVVAAMLLAVVLLFRPHGRGGSLAGACAAAFVASYSFGAGLVVWPAGLIGILLERDRPGRWTRAAVWTVAGAITVYLFLFVAGTPRRAAAFPSPDFTEPGYTLFFLGATGASVAGFNSTLAACVGFLAIPMLALLAWPLLRDRDWAPASVPFAVLALFGLGAAFLTMLGRGHEGLHDSVESRYTTLTTPLWIAMMGLLAIGQRRAPASWRLPVLLLIVTAMGLTSLQGAWTGSLRDPMQAAAREAIVSGDNDAILPGIFPDPGRYERRRAELERLGLGPFR